MNDLIKQTFIFAYIINGLSWYVIQFLESVEFRYEAVMCGGIPIIRSLQSDFVGDEIASICRIINGCTNYMLTAMDHMGQSYDDALKHDKLESTTNSIILTH